MSTAEHLTCQVQPAWLLVRDCHSDVCPTPLNATAAARWSHLQWHLQTSTSVCSSAGTTAGTEKTDDDAESAWRAYVVKCVGRNAKLTTPATCDELSGALCSRKDVKCSAGQTDFLDASGAVVATRYNEGGAYCFVKGPNAGKCIA